MHPAFTDTAHFEKYFESYIVKQLALRGWQVGDTAYARWAPTDIHPLAA